MLIIVSAGWVGWEATNRFSQDQRGDALRSLAVLIGLASPIRRGDQHLSRRRLKHPPTQNLPVGLMIDISLWVLLFICALVASILSAVTGFGGAAILLPVLVLIFGLRDAVPILTVAQLTGNGSRVWFNRSDIHYPVVGWFLLGAVPMALLGGWLFASAPLSFLTLRIIAGRWSFRNPFDCPL